MQGSFNERSGTVIAIAIYSQPQSAGFLLTMEIHSAKLPKRSSVKLSQIGTLSVERTGRRIERLAPEEITQLIFDWDEIMGD